MLAVTGVKSALYRLRRQPSADGSAGCVQHKLHMHGRGRCYPEYTSTRWLSPLPPSVAAGNGGGGQLRRKGDITWQFEDGAHRHDRGHGRKHPVYWASSSRKARPFARLPRICNSLQPLKLQVRRTFKVCSASSSGSPTRNASMFAS